MKNLIKDKKGFTLIELLLYVGITSFILSAVVMFIMTMLQVQAKNQTVSEVDQQGSQVLQIITQAIRNSNGINLPSIGANDTQLSLGMSDSSKNPTIFSINTGVFIENEGASIYPLTNSKVTIVNSKFTNLSRTGTPGVIKVEFTMAYVNPDGRDEYNYSKIFEASASLR